MRIDESQIEKFIIDSGLVSQKEMEESKAAAREKKSPIGKMLVSRGALTDDDLRRLEAHILGVPFVDLKNQKIDFSVLSLIPEPVSRNHNIVAFKKADGALEVAMLDIGDLAAIDFVVEKSGQRVLPRLTDTDSMKWALLSYQKSLKAEFGDALREEASGSREAGEGEDAPGVRIVETLLRHAFLEDASHIHVEPQEDQVLVRYRIGHALRDAMILPKNMAKKIANRVKALAHMKFDGELPQNGRFRIESGGEKISFSVSVAPIAHGERVVVRVLPENASGFTLESLGLDGGEVEEVHEALASRSGLILASGGKGSGKTTTLYTILDLLNAPHLSLFTIEDPIEYQMARVAQTQVRPGIGLTFENGLRTILRQDPDVIMVGEIRDKETAELALNAACAGRLVLAGVSTPSIPETIDFLNKLNLDKELLTHGLKLVIGHNLPGKEGVAAHRHEVLRVTPAALTDKV